MSLPRKEVRELGLVILVDARKGPATPALSQALAVLQVSQGDSYNWGAKHSVGATRGSLMSQEQLGAAMPALAPSRNFRMR